MSNNTFNILDIRTPENEEFIAGLIIEASGAQVNQEEKEELKALIHSLPEGATMASLIKEMKRAEAEKVGLNETTFEALLPLFTALHRMEAEKKLHPLDESHQFDKFNVKMDDKDEK
ncbi:hypothetical protein WKH15_21720 [Pantoea agglomerans]|uniref:hypothetical protein n=1 Tax=Enterobacter agglomerans TaxID=549 RepID=UPI003C79E04E